MELRLAMNLRHKIGFSIHVQTYIGKLQNWKQIENKIKALKKSNLA